MFQLLETDALVNIMTVKYLRLSIDNDYLTATILSIKIIVEQKYLLKLKD